MAKKNASRSDELFDLLRARGLRTRVARALSDAASTGGRASASSQSAAKRVISDLRSVADELEARLTGKDSRRSEAAKKAARTRARKASVRSASAKKGAATRKKAAAKSPAKRATAKAKTTAGRATKR
jgi:hypothetical protein